MKSQHNLLVLTCLLITQAVLAGHLCTAGEQGKDSIVVNSGLLDLSSLENAKISLEVDSSCILTAKSNISKAQTNNPKVIKVVPLSPTKLQLAALQPGVTTVSLWHENGDPRTVDVIVTEKVGRLRSLLDRLYPETKIEVVPLNSSVLLRGAVNDPRTVGEIRQIAEDFYPKVINQLSVDGRTVAGETYHRVRKSAAATQFRAVPVASLGEANLQQEIRALREEVGALRREIGQLTEAIKNAQPARPGSKATDSRTLPRPSVAAPPKHLPLFKSGNRVGWPVPHSVRPAPTATRVDFDHATSERPALVMMEARIFEMDEVADKQALDKVDRSGAAGREAAALVRAVIKGQLPDAKAVTAQLILGNLVGVINADDQRLSEWTGQLIAHDLAKVVSRPKLMTLSGQSATIRKGGEIPIVIPQKSGTVSVEYRQVGTRIEILPKVVDDGRIQLHVRPEFSELDADHALSVDGQTIPGLNTVRVQAAVELEQGQSLLIGGLPVGKKRHMIIVTPRVVSDADVAAKSMPSPSPATPAPGPSATRR